MGHVAGPRRRAARQWRLSPLRAPRPRHPNPAAVVRRRVRRRPLGAVLWRWLPRGELGSSCSDTTHLPPRMVR
eukprot:3306684-Prymnesium_polylepis.1